MNSRKIQYVVSLALMVGGIPLMAVSIPLGFFVMICGGVARKELDRSMQVGRWRFGTRRFHYVVTGYMVLSCFGALYLALSGYWHENGMPSGSRFALWGSPLLLLAAIEERRFYRDFIANGTPVRTIRQDPAIDAGFRVQAS